MGNDNLFFFSVLIEIDSVFKSEIKIELISMMGSKLNCLWCGGQNRLLVVCGEAYLTLVCVRAG